jgi:hypothetical protein
MRASPKRASSPLYSGLLRPIGNNLPKYWWWLSNTRLETINQSPE